MLVTEISTLSGRVYDIKCWYTSFCFFFLGVGWGWDDLHKTSPSGHLVAYGKFLHFLVLFPCSSFN